MTFEETTQLYATVLRQLLPIGGYDTSPNTDLAKDIQGHAKALAQCDLDAKRLLTVLEGIPPELLNEYEKEYGLPLKCTTNVAKSYAERIAVIQWIKNTKNVFNRTYLDQLLGIFGVTIVDLVRFVPFQCTQSCNQSLNTEQLRYKVTLKLRQPVQADMACIIKNYLPAFLRFDIIEV
ncbi:hypothetical protein [Acinetobacter defluvii]|uniref:hypothetical protein n=1 Tax=Acinetobacter defluvii TaxID=1871111 RepID=UPI003AF6D72D